MKEASILASSFQIIFKSEDKFQVVSYLKRLSGSISDALLLKDKEKVGSSPVQEEIMFALDKALRMLNVEVMGKIFFVIHDLTFDGKVLFSGIAPMVDFLLIEDPMEQAESDCYIVKQHYKEGDIHLSHIGEFMDIDSHEQKFLKAYLPQGYAFENLNTWEFGDEVYKTLIMFGTILRDFFEFANKIAEDMGEEHECNGDCINCQHATENADKMN